MATDDTPLTNPEAAAVAARQSQSRRSTMAAAHTAQSTPDDDDEHHHGGAAPAEPYHSKCVFCRIVNRDMDTELLHRDEHVSCFRDIRPAAPHHYLVVPTKHLGTCKSLSRQHVPLVEMMVATGKEILRKHDVTDLGDVRFGFHWPPFCSVTHLHLHVLAPVARLSFLSRIVFRPNSYWFITADQLIELLNSKGETE